MSHQFYFADHILENLPVPSTGFDVVQDMAEPNLRLYITSRGVKSFFVRKRIAGRDMRIIIGKYPEIDIDGARARVLVLLEDAIKPKSARRGVMSFQKICDMYITRRVKRAYDSLAKLKRAMSRHLNPLMTKNISDITSDDVRDVLNKIDGAAIRNRMQELLKSIFKFAIDNGYATQNPVLGIPKKVEVRRRRALTRPGLVNLIAAINDITEPTTRSAFLMLIYGFAPRSKIFSMQWRDLDFNHYMWGAMPLSDAAAALLEELPQNGRWVFPGRFGRHLTDPRGAWRDVVRVAGMPDLTMDDVHKFIMHRLVWAGDREQLRENMNLVISE